MEKWEDDGVAMNLLMISTAYEIYRCITVRYTILPKNFLERVAGSIMNRLPIMSIGQNIRLKRCIICLIVSKISSRKKLCVIFCLSEIVTIKRRGYLKTNQSNLKLLIEELLELVNAPQIFTNNHVINIEQNKNGAMVCASNEQC